MVKVVWFRVTSLSASYQYPDEFPITPRKINSEPAPPSKCFSSFFFPIPSIQISVRTPNSVVPANLRFELTNLADDENRVPNMMLLPPARTLTTLPFLGLSGLGGKARMVA